MKRVGVVVVLYHPDQNVLELALESLSKQVDMIALVDNSNDDHSAIAEKFINTLYIPLCENKGIAYAQNVGIKKMMYDCDYIGFSDQDSIAPLEVFGKLVDAYKDLTAEGVKVGAVGTRNINRQTGNPYMDKTVEMSLVGSELDKFSGKYTECFSVSSSISVISTKTLKEVGLMDEGLFIDGVDDEWCWRARFWGDYRTFIVEEAKISHMLGVGDRKILGKYRSITSPARLYYQYRNFIWLSKRNYTPSFWIKKNLVKYTIKLIYYPLFVVPRLVCLKNIMRGIIDGLFTKPLITDKT